MIKTNYSPFCQSFTLTFVVYVCQNSHLFTRGNWIIHDTNTAHDAIIIRGTYSRIPYLRVKGVNIHGQSWWLIGSHKPRYWSTSVQVMACCPMVPSHYLNQWLVTSPLNVIITSAEQWRLCFRFAKGSYCVQFQAPDVGCIYIRWRIAS